MDFGGGESECRSACGGGGWWWCSRDLVKMQRERRSKRERERESPDRQRGSGRMDGRENERMNKTGEKKLETHITVGQKELARV